MKKVLVCFQHALTTEQSVSLGSYGEVSHLRDVDPDLFARLCNTPGETERLRSLAHELHYVAIGDMLNYDYVVLPIGSPAFMFMFSGVCKTLGGMMPEPVYLFAHSVRDSVDEPQADGSIVKRSIFRHEKWIEM